MTLSSILGANVLNGANNVPGRMRIYLRWLTVLALGVMTLAMTMLLWGRRAGHKDFTHLLTLSDMITPAPAENVDFKSLLVEYSEKIEHLQKIGSWERSAAFNTCATETHPAKPCVDTNCPVKDTPSLHDNLRDVLQSMHWVDEQQYRLLVGLFNARPTHKRVMFVTAGSSNHYDESQALIENLHKNVFPFITNYTFVYYDLGLSYSERKQLQRHCRCEVRSYPQEYMPDQIKNLNCYTWKPFIINANLPTTDVLIWMDTSIRFWNRTIKQIIRSTEDKGMLTYLGYQGVGYVTLKPMFDYFQERACNFASATEVQAGFLLFHNERFIRQAVVRPWVACAMHPKCMCPDEPSKVLSCDMTVWKYSRCHRFDLSAISIIMGKLFSGYEASFFSPYNAFPNVTIEREQKSHYLAELDKGS